MPPTGGESPACHTVLIPRISLDAFSTDSALKKHLCTFLAPSMVSIKAAFIVKEKGVAFLKLSAFTDQVRDALTQAGFANFRLLPAEDASKRKRQQPSPESSASKAATADANEAVDEKNGVKEKQPADPDTLDRKVFVRNLPESCTLKHVSDHFADAFGERPRRVFLVKSRLLQEGGKHTGSAFAEFESREAAERVLGRAKKAQVSSLNSADKVSSDAIAQLAQKITGSVSFTSMIPTVASLGDAGNPLIFESRELLLAPAKTPQQILALHKRPLDPRRIDLLGSLEAVLAAAAASSRDPAPARDGGWLEEQGASLGELRRRMAHRGNLQVSATRLCIRHLPRSVDEAALKDFIRSVLQDRLSLPASSVSAVKLETIHFPGEEGTGTAKKAQNSIHKRDKRRGEGSTRGFAFVQCRSHESARALCELLISQPTAWFGIVPALKKRFRSKKSGKEAKEPAEMHAKIPLIAYALDKKGILEGIADRLGKDSSEEAAAAAEPRTPSQNNKRKSQKRPRQSVG